MHAFWSRQPVPRDASDTREGQLEDKSEARDTPWPLPKGFGWDDLNVADPDTLDEVHKFLTAHYVTSPEGSVRMTYSPDTLQWALCAPGQRPGFVFGVRAQTEKRSLVGMIAAIPHRVREGRNVLDSPMITFHCVHPKLRGKRLAPMLMREVSRRVRRAGLQQMVYTAGVELPTPFVDVPCCTRLLSTVPEMDHKWRVRPMRHTDLDAVRTLLEARLDLMRVAPVLETDEELAYYLMPSQQVVASFVVTLCHNQDKVVAFVTMPRVDVLQTSTDTTIRHAFLGYLGWNDEWTNLSEVVRFALFSAKLMGFHALSAYDAGARGPVLRANGFEDGEAVAHYHFYNWGAPGVQPEDLELFLI